MIPRFDHTATEYSLDNARLMGQAAAMAYRGESEIVSWANANGFDAKSLQCFSRRDQGFGKVCDTQGFIAENDLSMVVAFRGTEPKQIIDWLNDAQIRHSAWGTSQSRIIQQCDQIEAALKSSGLPWTLLKPTFYMQNLMLAAQSISADGVFYWDMGEGKLAMIDVRDIVESAFAVITGSGHEGKSYILTGPEAISLHDAANAFSEALGKDVRYVSVPGEAVLGAMTGMGFPEWIARGYLELDEGFSQGFASVATNNVAMLTGHPARSFAQFAHDYAEVFGGAAIAVAAR
jgi:hypothetical protein